MQSSRADYLGLQTCELEAEPGVVPYLNVWKGLADLLVGLEDPVILSLWEGRPRSAMGLKKAGNPCQIGLAGRDRTYLSVLVLRRTESMGHPLVCIHEWAGAVVRRVNLSRQRAGALKRGIHRARPLGRGTRRGETPCTWCPCGGEA